MRNVAHKIVLAVQSALTQGKTEDLTKFQARQRMNTSDTTIYTQFLDKKDRMETVGEAVNRFIRSIDNPVYSIKDVSEREFQPAY